LRLIKEENSAGKSPFSPRSNITTLVTKDGKMYIGSTVDFSSSDSAILRIDLSTDSSKILRTRQYNEIELFKPDFVGSFEHGEFVYFVFREISIEAVSQQGSREVISRIARICKNDTGNSIDI
jgi:chondroitin sulfate proteoglycan 4